MPAAIRISKLFWAFPNTLLGLLFLPFSFFKGGYTYHRGVMEIYNPIIAWGLEKLIPVHGGARALTLGHVILGRCSESIRRSRQHERVHVKQYERYGPLFIPLYILSSLSARFHGQDPYRYNHFEIQAFLVAGYCEE